jgi:hypothetical protein
MFPPSISRRRARHRRSMLKFNSRGSGLAFGTRFEGRWLCRNCLLCECNARVALDGWLQLRFARVLETASGSAVDPEGFRIPLSSLLGIETGELAGARTQDPRLKRAMLYQLSYELLPSKNNTHGSKCPSGPGRLLPRRSSCVEDSDCESHALANDCSAV